MLDIIRHGKRELSLLDLRICFCFALLTKGQVKNKTKMVRKVRYGMVKVPMQGLQDWGGEAVRGLSLFGGKRGVWEGKKNLRN